MSERYDIVTIGHVTHDNQTYRGKTTWFTGGGAYFCAFAAKASGARARVVTRLAQEDHGLLEGLRAAEIDVLALPSRATTSIENIFETDDLDKRTVRLLSQADPFRLEDIPEEAAQLYNLTGLFRGEIPPELIEPLSRRGKVALDLQGVLRTSEGGRFSWQDWPDKERYLPHLEFLKADSLESAVITGSEDRYEAIRRLRGWGAREVMVTHSSEVIVYDGRHVHAAPFDPANLSGRTGRGDTCFGSYLAWRLQHGVEESLRYAAALTSMKMETPGPFQGSIEDVLARLSRQRSASRSNLPASP
jgi:sugar/nucleoside kinase (ribokinase family)